jgi:hypothetical protein
LVGTDTGSWVFIHYRFNTIPYMTFVGYQFVREFMMYFSALGTA